MMFSFPFFENFKMRAWFVVPALCVLNAGDGAPDAAMKESDLGRLLGVGCDA
ncbi:hypothetical protein [Methylobacterium sp. CM6244]